ncbi:complexed with cef1p [Microbotryomycetes sp. JL201]|nr:complexed with cef1p [Microbotryomycetes sp. JL201]
MSSAHRPTWDPAQGKAARGNSRIYSVRDMASHTRLKFRQPGQGSTTEVARRDLKAELVAAEREAAERKAKGQSGFVADRKLLALENEQAQSEADATEAKRRKVLASVGNLDADDDDDNDDDDDDDEDDDGKEQGAAAGRVDKGKGKAVDLEANGNGAGKDDDDDGDDDDDDDSDDDDEDETAELLRELEKIKRERAEEKERQERERLESEQVDREAEIAMGNPLLNLEAALGRTPSGASATTSASTSFGVKRRWDDDVIFKNQAVKDDKPKPAFVNDLLRTDFNRKFLKRFIA